MIYVSIIYIYVIIDRWVDGWTARWMDRTGSPKRIGRDSSHSWGVDRAQRSCLNSDGRPSRGESRVMAKNEIDKNPWKDRAFKKEALQFSNRSRRVLGAAVFFP